MKLIVPMSGQGSRFKAVGYETLKPLIMVEGKPILAHVLDMFPGIEEVVFICNEEHLAGGEMESILKKLRPDAEMVAITSHRKGPVYDISQAFDHIKDTDEIIVSYCDFTQNWDFNQFREKIKAQETDGSVPCYTGFHPHLLKRNLYAGVLLNDNGTMKEIREKHCFTDNPVDSHHSSGIYHFKNGKLLKYYFNKLMSSGETLNGEYYISMVYPLMLADGLSVSVPPIEHFMQWGTPEDLEEYEAWSRLVHNELKIKKETTEIPSKREPLVYIPHPNNSKEFIDSYNYWLEYFKQKI